MRYTPKERALNTYRVLNEISPPIISFLEQREPYQLLISVILSAQTTDRQVNEIAGELFKRF
ncbi:MAG: endonuclease III, partial [Sphaerochaetaceae bacterium]